MLERERVGEALHAARLRLVGLRVRLVLGERAEEILVLPPGRALEEAIAGDPGVDLTRTWEEFSKSLALTGAVLEGGRGEHGMMPEPMREGRPRLEAGSLKALLNEFGVVALQRMADPKVAVAGSPLDERFDRLFKDILARAKALEVLLEEGHARDEAKSRKLFFGTLLIWALVVIALTAGIWNRELRRKRAEEDLQKANEELEWRVEERTGELIETNVSLQDEIAERRLVEAELRKSEERYRMLVETMNDGLAVVDTKGALTYVNERFCEMLGYSFGELVGHPCADFVADADKDLFREEMEKRRRGEHAPYGLTLAGKDGRMVIADVSPKAILDREGNFSGSFAVLTDVTEKIALQADAIRAAHLASIGELSAGIAHEIRNPLVGIGSTAALLRDEIEATDPKRADLDIILNETRRLDRIVNQIINYARPRDLVPTTWTVNEMIDEVLKLVDTRLERQRIAVVRSCESDLVAYADRDQVKQVLLNLCHNSLDAMTSGGELGISSGHSTHAAHSGIFIEVSDTGSGIAKKDLSQVFQPFFTTGKQHGTGLGLAICRNIADAHGGDIALTSQPGRGTKARLWLPLRPTPELAGMPT